MSDAVIRTPAGDMLALIPQDWFFIETMKKYRLIFCSS